ncbi:MAG TPA: prolyl oligopeptidase family serine peptidase [Gemmatimonadaceae bacterium]|nr:prolyl oligopeptidase family serine peptidase [Gemmatimonadaceae bacterium]
MSAKYFLSALLVWAPTVGAQQASNFDFSIKNIMRGPELYGRAPDNVQWSNDSRWIYFTWLEPGTDWRETPKRFRVRAAPGAKPERVSPAQFDSAGALVSDGDRSKNGRYMAVEFGGDIYVTDLQKGTTRRLTRTNAREHDPVFATNANKIFFVRDDNVYSIDLDGGLIEQLTDIRQGPEPTDSTRAAGQRGRLEQQQRDLFEVIRDRVRADSIRKAEEKERNSRGLKTYYTQRGENIGTLAVAPTGDGLLITTRLTPSSPARSADFIQFVTESGYPEVVRGRSNVGDVQFRGRLGFLNLKSGTIKWLNAFPTDTATGFVQALGWTNDGKRAAFYSYTGDNKVRLLQSIDAATGKVTTIETLRDSAWVGGPCSFCGGWYDNGRRLWYISEATGFAHLYTIAADGSDRRQLTQGNWEVRGASLSPDEKTFYLLTNEISPAEEQIYRMSVNGGTREKLTTKSGGHKGVVSPDGQWIADVYSYVNRPPDLYLMRNQPGAEESQLTVSPSAEWLSFPWIEPELIKVPASDGVGVPAHIYRPADMKAQPNGAAVIFVHGAGYLHNVGNFWSQYPREYMFNQYLASKGYVVLDLDYRASDGYGRDWRTAIYRYMGGRDLQDQVDASKYLTKTFNIDPERIGLYGGSYGGFITLMALFTQPQYFGAGSALRSVTDWAHYNNGYTSAILNFPQTDTLSYRRSSPIYFAEGLKDPLLMAHGMVDANVHFEDIVRLTQRLIELGKTNWDLAVYPVEDHGFVRPSSWADEYRRIFEIFERTLPSRVPIQPDK